MYYQSLVTLKIYIYIWWPAIETQWKKTPSIYWINKKFNRRLRSGIQKYWEKNYEIRSQTPCCVHGNYAIRWRTKQPFWLVNTSYMFFFFKDGGCVVNSIEKKKKTQKEQKMKWRMCGTNWWDKLVDGKPPLGGGSWFLHLKYTQSIDVYDKILI